MLVAGKCGDIVVSFSQWIDGAIYRIEEYEMWGAWWRRDIHTGCGIGGSCPRSSQFCRSTISCWRWGVRALLPHAVLESSSTPLYGCLSSSFPTETLHTFNISHKSILLIQLRFINLWGQNGRSLCKFTLSLFLNFCYILRRPCCRTALLCLLLNNGAKAAC